MGWALTAMNAKYCLIAILPLLAACAAQQPEEPSFEIDPAHVMSLAREMLAADAGTHYADRWTAAAIEGDTCALWFGSDGVIDSANTLLMYLGDAVAEGMSEDFFGIPGLQQNIDSVSAWALTGRHHLLTDSLAAVIEADLTRALMRYAYGQRYGYILPGKLHNNLLPDYDSPPDRPRPNRLLYDIPCDEPSDSLSAVVIDCLRHDSIDCLLRSLQPVSKHYALIAKDYKRAIAANDTARAVKALVNMERNRWRYDRPDSGMYVMVNLAAQSLRAVDLRGDSCIEMRICCGNQTHKSPMLVSRIKYIEVDPYWSVPLSILRNEVARLHVNDSAYFARNRMFAIDNNSGDTVPPTSLSARQWSSGRYTLKQDRGKGNSLGRLIFRFPNIFSVYLHDTNQPGMFRRDIRTVSHGCIRVERPMDLTNFILRPEVSPLFIDRIRISIDLKPVTDEGRRLLEGDQEPKPVRQYDLRRPVPLWIDYYTLYPDSDGVLCEYPDIYSYDEAIARAMRSYCTLLSSRGK